MKPLEGATNKGEKKREPKISRQVQCQIKKKMGCLILFQKSKENNEKGRNNSGKEDSDLRTNKPINQALPSPLLFFQHFQHLTYTFVTWLCLVVFLRSYHCDTQNLLIKKQPFCKSELLFPIWLFQFHF